MKNCANTTIIEGVDRGLGVRRAGVVGTWSRGRGVRERRVVDGKSEKIRAGNCFCVIEISLKMNPS